MKAIKIASGVAISALAAAISAQAHAEGDTEFSWSAVGSMEAMFVYNFEAENKDVDLDEGDDFDSQTAGEAWGLETTLSIVHGPFSGGFTLTADDSTDVEVSLEDIVITDGAISFGQVGSLIETHDYAYDMDDSETGVTVKTGETAVFEDANDDDIVDAGEGSYEAVNATVAEDLDEGAPVDVGIRYTMGGLQVQLEGQNGDNAQNGTDYGVGAAFSGTVDALSYRVDGQVRASDDAPDTADVYTYVGAGVTYTADMFMVKAAYNTYTTPTTAVQVGTQEKEMFSEYGVEVEVTPIAALTAYVKAQDLDASSVAVDDSMKVLVGAAYTIDTITVTGEYLYTAINSDSSTADQTAVFNGSADDLDFLDNVFVEVAYADGAIGAYVDATFYTEADFADDVGPQFGAGASYTQDNGVVYSADYDFQTLEDVNLDNENKLKVSAAYAF